MSKKDATHLVRCKEYSEWKSAFFETPEAAGAFEECGEYDEIEYKGEM